MASGVLGAAGVAALPAPKGVTGLPLSVWHIGLGWLDVATDVIGIISTWVLSNTINDICGVNLQQYVFICFLTLCCLFGGNLLTQTVLAVVHEIRFRPDGATVSPTAIVLAALRGLFQCELAYHEFQRNKGGSSAHTAAALHFRMAELVWEAPQVITSWLCLVVSLTYIQMAAIDGVTLNHKVAWIPMQLLVLNAVVGVVSLSVAAQEFVRLHPRSAWATSMPPAKLFLGIIDVTDTWWLSVVSFVHAFLSLFNRTVFWMLLIHNFATWGITRGTGRPALWRVPVIVAGGSLALNLVFLAGMGLLVMFPAAVISMFITIPWASGTTAQQRVSKWSIVPGWLLQVVYSGGMLAVFLIAGIKSRHSPDALASHACKQPVRNVLAGYNYLLLTTFLPLCTTLLELLLFSAVSAWQFARRHQYSQKHGASNYRQMAHDLRIACHWPASSCIYKWKGLFVYRLMSSAVALDLLQRQRKQAATLDAGSAKATDSVAISLQ